MLISTIFVLPSAGTALDALLHAFQPKYVSFPNQALSYTPADMGIEQEERYLTTRDSISIHAWYIPGAGSRNTLLFLHGLDFLHIFMNWACLFLLSTIAVMV